MCPLVLLCSSSLVHTSLLSLQLATLLHEHRRCVCVSRLIIGLNPNQPGILLACLRGSGVALAASQGHVSLSKRCLCGHPCIIPAAHHPRLGLLRLPLVCLALCLICVHCQRHTLKSCVCMCNLFKKLFFLNINL